MISWSVQVERLVGSIIVVSTEPSIEGVLHRLESVPLAVGEDVFSHGAMHSFVFATGLGMVGPAMKNVDVQ